MRFLATLGGFCFATLVAAGAGAPDYLRAAINNLSSDAPRGWAYTLTTTREKETTAERFDPSKPQGGEWTLLSTNGRPPSAGEITRYLRYKSSNTPVAKRGTFERGELDIDSAQLLREDDTHAEFRMRFRGDVSEPVLPHVVLEARVQKSTASVESCVLRLVEPFSPALGMRMNELTVTMKFTPPRPDLPALPLEVSSHFRGRLFLVIPVAEDLRVVFSDFARLAPAK
ncbi:MAG: hypothetical protein C0502_03820 [Opitutus sp.]|nr:hypothetical protein [Opitutus sp.]